MRIILLKGRETFLRDAYTAKLKAALAEAHGEIQCFEFDGETAEPAAVLDELRSFGLLQQHKLVIVDKADKLIAAGGAEGEGDPPAKKGGKKSPTNTSRAMLERYAASPVDDATLLLRAETWRPGNLDKAIKKIGAVIACEPVKEDKAVIWCSQRCSQRYDAQIDRAAAAALVGRIGPHLDRLDAELLKLATFIGPGGAITREHVSAMVGMSREDTAWTIQNAIASGRTEVALGKLDELMSVSRVDREPLSWSLMELTRKMHAAGWMLRQGESAGVISKHLRLWGVQDGVMRAARANTPSRLAELFAMTVRNDRNAKRGVGNPIRSLEVATRCVADTMKST